MAWSNQVPVQHLGGLEWSSRSRLFAKGKGGYGGAPLQIRELSQRMIGAGPNVIVSSGDFLPLALAAAVEVRFPRGKASQDLRTDRSLRPAMHSYPRRAPTQSSCRRRFPLPGFRGICTSRSRSDRKENPGESKRNLKKNSRKIYLAGPTLMCGYWRSGGDFEPMEGPVFRDRRSLAPSQATVWSRSTVVATMYSSCGRRKSRPTQHRAGVAVDIGRAANFACYP